MEYTIEACTTEAEIARTYPVIRQLYPLPLEEYIAYAQEMMAVDYHLFAMFEGDRCLAVVGYRVGRRLYCGKYLHIDNMIVDENCRGQGVAQAIISWLREEAGRLGCDTVLADTYVGNHTAQSTFIKAGFHIRGYHLKLDVKHDYKTTFTDKV